LAKSKQTSESESNAPTSGDTDEPQQETTIEFLASLASVLVTGLFIITFVLQAFEIPSGSMQNTLLIGDHVFVNREQFAPPSSTLGKLLPYRRPHNDEVAVFVHPAQPGIFLVKRIIGIPGDRLRVRGGVVYRNGQKLNEPFTKHMPLEQRVVYADNFPAIPPEGYAVTPEWGATQVQFIQGGEVFVPQGYFFAMGDNRDNSNDSRYWGFVPQENLIGRPMFIYWSFDTPDDQSERKAFAERVGFLLHTVLHFFDMTRWGRTFKVVR
jgi:signal peptidase I